MNKKTRSPLFHITKRDALPWYKSWGIRAAADPARAHRMLHYYNDDDRRKSAAGVCDHL